ncbi:MAG: hypothetical protein FWF80_08925, partial [Defluviitaleaceae bacterium]|nr:hypothetical protein [Defluviitaleaceae bacterium]
AWASSPPKGGRPAPDIGERAIPVRKFTSCAAPPDFVVGDNVRQAKYGVGRVLEISPAGADYEVTVQFPDAGRKKFMSGLARLTKEI